MSVERALNSEVTKGARDATYRSYTDLNYQRESSPDCGQGHGVYKKRQIKIGNENGGNLKGKRKKTAKRYYISCVILLSQLVLVVQENYKTQLFSTFARFQLYPYTSTCKFDS